MAAKYNDCLEWPEGVVNGREMVCVELRPLSTKVTSQQTTSEQADSLTDCNEHLVNRYPVFSVCLSISSLLCLSVCLYPAFSVCLSVFLYPAFSVRLSVYIQPSLSVCLSV